MIHIYTVMGHVYHLLQIIFDMVSPSSFACVILKIGIFWESSLNKRKYGWHLHIVVHYWAAKYVEVSEKKKKH